MRSVSRPPLPPGANSGSSHKAYALRANRAYMSLSSGGGADGSIALFEDVETNFHANLGVDEIINEQREFIQRHNLTTADLYVAREQRFEFPGS